MTNPSIEQFYQVVSNNRNLQQHLSATSTLKDFAELAVELGHNQGYHFSVEEVKTAIAQKQSQVYELSNEQLVAVAGGKGEGGNGDLADIFHEATEPAPEDASFFCPASTVLHDNAGDLEGDGGLSWG